MAFMTPSGRPDRRSKRIGDVRHKPNVRSDKNYAPIWNRHSPSDGPWPQRTSGRAYCDCSVVDVGIEWRAVSLQFPGAQGFPISTLLPDTVSARTTLAEEKRMRSFAGKVFSVLKPKRRWLQFSLRILFVVTTLVALWLSWTAYVGFLAPHHTSPKDFASIATNGLPEAGLSGT